MSQKYNDRVFETNHSNETQLTPDFIADYLFSRTRKLNSREKRIFELAKINQKSAERIYRKTFQILVTILISDDLRNLILAKNFSQ